ncbi:helix-turn-helix domain-containing protein [Labrenzia sp. R4_2]|uniref:AraC family transcriptional regulator n=1 Tax=Labrenzia sp. R4_2 TaxID=2821107 RepID=UPI001ADB6D82|nr:AraC family transcriptional regulator [Labrenzia sp. R4_2]MBO9417917.1 helix-turn-helix domain-containing protein [Labrenzia sp. R4_2]
MPRKFPVDPGVRVVLAELDLDLSEVLLKAQLPPMALQRTPAGLTGPEILQFWQGIVASRDPIDVALATATVAASTSFSPLLFACTCSPTYEIAVERLRTHKALLGPFLLRLDYTRDTLTVTPEAAPELEYLPDSLATAEVAFQKALIDHSTRMRIKPVRVNLPEQIARDVRMEEFFNIQPCIGDEVGITFSLEDSRKPFLTHDSSMWDYFEPELQRRLSAIESTDSVAELTRAALLELLPTGDVAIGTVASRLALSPRTLQRRLDQECTSFKGVLSALRCELAEVYLSKDVSVAEVAFLLAYSEVNSFQRAFKGWKSETPEHYRQKLIH